MKITVDIEEDESRYVAFLGDRPAEEGDRGTPGLVHHLDGVSWILAPAPPRWHAHRAQTTATIDGLRIDRCPCGATRLHLVSGRPWTPEKHPRRASIPWWSALRKRFGRG